MAENAAQAAEGGSAAVDTMADTVGSISEAIENTVSVMDTLGKRSKEIGDITEVIDDIAEQTNLLALNAAIEAARAGEHGRGFAVVADAVRDLAERATASTKEIASLIQSIQADTEQAVEVTMAGASKAEESRTVSEEAREALGNITSTFKGVLESMQQIRAAAGEQSKGGQQVLAAVQDMGGLHGEVDRAIKEQAKGSSQIVDAVERMNQLVGEVVNATGEQKRGGEQMVTAMEAISGNTRENRESISNLVQSAQDLAVQSESLRELARGFNLEGHETTPDITPVEDERKSA
jgi:methyl-accepting chemotaxis protein